MNGLTMTDGLYTPFGDVDQFAQLQKAFEEYRSTL
jgi:hypothetical protein